MRSLHCIAFFPVLLGLAVSCTVKEDRMECPVYLHFEKVGNPYQCGGDAEVYGFTKHGSVPALKERRSLAVLLAGEEVFPLSKGTGVVTVIASKGSMTGSVNTAHEYRIPEGRQMDRIYALSERIETTEDDCWVGGRLLRQFADVTMTMSYLQGQPCPFDLTVLGPSAGFDVRTLSPVEGRFRLDLESEPDASYRFRLPRQERDGRLFLELRAPGSSEPLHTMALSDYLDKVGYDWTADDLPEISLDVDFARLSVTVTVAGWDYVLILDSQL